MCFAPSDDTADMEKLGTPLRTPSTGTRTARRGIVGGVFRVGLGGCNKVLQ